MRYFVVFQRANIPNCMNIFTRAKISSASVNVSLSASRLKTGIRRIMRREALYALMRLQRRTKAFTACGRIMRLNV